jgi:heme/copper-type cytochrome/quinol oxidase subunit 3
MEELGNRDGDPERLPLAIAGPMANGWWGTLILIAVLATALVSFVASYYYLTEAPAVSSSPAETLLWPALVTLLPLLGVPASVWAVRGLRGRRTAQVRAGLAVTALLTIVSLAVSMRTYPWDTLEPERSAYASSILGLVGFQWLVMVLLLVAVAIALSWAFFSPRDERGDAVVHNTSLLATFTGISAAVVFLVVYLTPLLA